MIMKGDYVRIWNKTVMVYLKVLIPACSGKTEENNENTSIRITSTPSKIYTRYLLNISIVKYLIHRQEQTCSEDSFERHSHRS
jgi:hypothetical protein